MGERHRSDDGHRLPSNRAEPRYGRAVVAAYRRARSRAMALASLLEAPPWTMVVGAAVIAAFMALAKRRSWRVPCPDCGAKMVATRFRHYKDRDYVRHRAPTRLECDACEVFVDLGDPRFSPP